MEVHESTTIDVAPLPKYEYVKRVALAIEPPSAAESWRLQLAFSTVMRHRVDRGLIEKAARPTSTNQEWIG